MMSPSKNSRPNCDKILRDRKSWTLDLQQLRKLAKFQSEELEPSDKNFYSTFIQIKLKNEKKKEDKSIFTRFVKSIT